MKISAVKPVIVGDQRNFFFVVVETVIIGVGIPGIDGSISVRVIVARIAIVV